MLGITKISIAPTCMCIFFLIRTVQTLHTTNSAVLISFLDTRAHSTNTLNLSLLARKEVPLLLSSFSSTWLADIGSDAREKGHDGPLVWVLRNPASAKSIWILPERTAPLVSHRRDKLSLSSLSHTPSTSTLCS